MNTTMPSPAKPLTVALVGRPNVGKSALFNRFAGRQISIVHDQPGVTRDRVAAPSAVTKTACQVIDTGGIGMIADAEFSNDVGTKAQVAMETADLILFVVDAREGLHPIDEELARTLRRASAPVQLVLNKADHENQDDSVDEFSRAGIRGAHCRFGRPRPKFLQAGRMHRRAPRPPRRVDAGKRRRNRTHRTQDRGGGKAQRREVVPRQCHPQGRAHHRLRRGRDHP